VESAVPGEAAQAAGLLQSFFGSDLAAVYLFGSAVAGKLKPQSDIDLLAIIERPMSVESRRTFVAKLMAVSGRYPVAPGGSPPLELTVFLRSDLARFGHPTRSELVYGEWLRPAFEAAKPAGPVSNADLTLLIAQARQQARALIGPPPAELLPIVAAADIKHAIADSLPDLLGSLAGDERNVLLTLARMWRTLATGDFVSKDQAAEWALPRLPPETASLILQARDEYLGGAIGDWHARRREAENAARYLNERLAEIG
jgi:streptomycin 3"-adenylyltransferase